jgi:outer membrane lipoprotein LolB
MKDTNIMMTRIKQLILAVFTLVSSACVTHLPIQQQQQIWQQHSDTIAALQQWDVRGRIALQMDDEAWQLNMRWQRLPEQQQIDLSGPFGMGAVRMLIDARGAHLRDASQMEYRADNAQELLWQTTGWLLPLDNLSWWLRGLPVPNKQQQMQLDGQGRLGSLTQDGWQLTVLEYEEQQGMLLPHLIELHNINGDTYGKSMRLRLVISQWLDRG